MASALAETLKDLHDVFEGLGVRWYVFGAQAAIFHGVVRATADIDVTVDLGARGTCELVKGLTDGAFELRVADDEFIDKTRVLPVLHARTRVPVDVVLAGPGLEELFFDRMVEREVGGVIIPVASSEDLIVMKILAGRPKDLEDVRGVLSAKMRPIDVAQIRETLGLLERALDQSDLLPVFEDLLGAIGSKDD
jgi:hypothetical protein